MTMEPMVFCKSTLWFLLVSDNGTNGFLFVTDFVTMEQMNFCLSQILSKGFLLVTDFVTIEPMGF